MQHLGGNISKEIGGRIRNWRGSFWERRFDQIVVSSEPEAQWRRLKYHLSKGSASYYTSLVVCGLRPLEAACFRGSGRSSRPSGFNS